MCDYVVYISGVIKAVWFSGGDCGRGKTSKVSFLQLDCWNEIATENLSTSNVIWAD